MSPSPSGRGVGERELLLLFLLLLLLLLLTLLGPHKAVAAEPADKTRRAKGRMPEFFYRTGMSCRKIPLVERTPTA